MSVVRTMNSKRTCDEIRHANTELEYFYLEARRNKKAANWAAKKLGRNKKEYFLELISEDISQAGPKPVVKRIRKDFKKAGLDISEDKIWKKLRTFEQYILKAMLRKQAKRTKKELKGRKKNKKK
ncbi:conserved hypothetical protein [Candidatus Terasakiella magnetica]|uniref:Uncharacterized protein n=1 Tax=Candidatus Terasakiella magnetica TaxID=1867952 RepID=A0A1C3REG8_9PROT|nr:ATPase inhibitor subunit zeta [Candidatus Terasakiella magnetica]SCA55631.1 conserved hypothetical protein [Candidatus Terasakiella magnetica]